MNDGQESTTPAGQGRAEAGNGDNRRRHNVTRNEAARQGAAPFLDAAKAYAARGWPVFPVRRKAPAIPKGRGGNGYHDASTDPAELEALWKQAGRGVDGLGVDLERAGLVLLDCDPRNGGNLEELAGRVGELPATVAARTGGGGAHRFYRRPEGCPPTSKGNALGPGLDVKANGYAVLPPSRHPAGDAYAWTADPDTVEIATAPPWLVAALSAPQAPRDGNGASGVRSLAGYVRAAVDGELVTLASAREGERNATLNRSAFSLGELVGAGHLSEGDAVDVLRRGAMACGLWGDDGERSCLATIHSGLEAGRAQPRMIDAPAIPERVTPPASSPRNGTRPRATPRKVRAPHCPPGLYSRDDIGNGERLVHLYGDRLLYVEALGGWHAYDGKRWALDDAGQARAMAQRTARGIVREAAEAADAGAGEEEVKALASFAAKCSASARLSNMLTEAQPHVSARPDALDRDPWLFNVQNGTLDLRTGELRAHDPADMLTRLAPVPYDPRAQAPTWRAFLDRIFAGDRDLIAFVQRLAGYALTGSNREQVLTILHGNGANGKTTFVNALTHVMGDRERGGYATHTPAGTLLASRYDAGTGPTPELAALYGARLVTAAESDASRRLAEALVKEVTGGEPVTCRVPYARTMLTFYPTFTLVLATNHRPRIVGTDWAIWRRIRLVPFNVTIPEEERDPELSERLAAEAPGILAWALEGCRDWQAHGLGVPEAVKTATEAYRSEQDVFAAFLDDCTVHARNADVMCAELYTAYVRWCEGTGERAESDRRFRAAMTERGYERRTTTGGRHMYLGVGLLAPSDPSDPSDPNSGKIPHESNQRKLPETGSLASLASLDITPNGDGCTEVDP